MKSIIGFGLCLLLFATVTNSLEIKSAVSRKGHHHHSNGHKILKPLSKPTKKLVTPINTKHTARFKAVSEGSSEGEKKLHIDTSTTPVVSLLGSTAKVGAEVTAQASASAAAAAEAQEEDLQVEQIATFSGGSYSNGLGDEAQASATIEDALVNELKSISKQLSDETTRATKSEDNIKTEYTDMIEKNKQERQKAEKDIQTAIDKEQNARKQADDTRAKSENDVTQNLNDQISKLNDKVSTCSQNVQKAVQKANSLEAIVNAYTDKKGGGTKIAFLAEHEHVYHLHRLHMKYHEMAKKYNF